MTPPNIVLIVMDTARADVVAPTSEHTPMPKLADLGQGGTIFTSASSNSPWTLPSHATIFSGQYTSHHQTHAANVQFDYEPTLPSRLRECGYTTIGVSNNTWVSGEFGFDRGFDKFYTTWRLFQDGVDFGDIAQTEFGMKNQLLGILKKFRGNPLKNLANLIYGRFLRKRNDDGARRTNEIIAENLDDWVDESPFFLFLNYLEPHLEYRPPDRVASRYLPGDVTLEEAASVNQDAWAYISGEIEMSGRDFDILRALYTAELAYLDERIEELHRVFQDVGAAEQTVFIVTADHGENIGDHGLMDHQYSLHETLLSVPLAIFGPGFDGSAVIGTPVQLLDIAPTVLDIASESSIDELPGESLASPQDLPQDRPMYAEYVSPQPAIETLKDRYDCRNNVEQYDRLLRAVRLNDSKYVRGSDGSEWLFDLTRDPGEMVNDVDENPERHRALRRRLETWTESLPPIDRSDTSMAPATERRLEDLGYL